MTPAILVFIGIAYAFAIAIGVAVALTGGHRSPLLWLGYASMFVPAIAVLIVRSTMNEGLRIDWSRLPLKYVPLSVLLVPIVLHAVMLPVAGALEGRLVWKDYTAGHIAINAAIGLVVVSALAFFEEIGWRGWLLPRLAERMGPGRAIVAVAVA